MTSQVHWKGTSDASTSDNYNSRLSDRSYQTQGTIDTVYSDRPQLQHYDTCFAQVESYPEEPFVNSYDDFKASVETYASTEPSEYELSDDGEPEYDLLDYPDDHYQSDAIPTTPKDFANLFPSARRMDIRHDDSTIDGNMNLRVDTLVGTPWSHQKQNVTLFHLRMQDLKSRDFSLRRYCRDSGREVCHSVRKYQTLRPERRPSFTKSFSSALAPFRKLPDHKTAGIENLRRHDSGYGSIFSEDLDEKRSTRRRPEQRSRLPTNTIKLEFSNYAHIDVKRRGSNSSKGYEFEYWGFNYTWKRHVKREGKFEEVSYHLLRNDKVTPLAHILPVPLTTTQMDEEVLKGGWVPPCSMWIKDDDILKALPDVADVVISSGLIALVDDSIKRRWHSNQHRQMLRPLSRGSSFRMNLEYIGPKRLIDGVFNRRTTFNSSPMHRSGSTEV